MFALRRLSDFAAAGPAGSGCSATQPGFKFIEGTPNLDSLDRRGMYLGIDGICLLLVMLTTLLGLIAILSSWNAIRTA